MLALRTMRILAAKMLSLFCWPIGELHVLMAEAGSVIIRFLGGNCSSYLAACPERKRPQRSQMSPDPRAQVPTYRFASPSTSGRTSRHAALHEGHNSKVS
jgi:hypothetical protein